MARSEPASTRPKRAAKDGRTSWRDVNNQAPPESASGGGAPRAQCQGWHGASQQAGMARSEPASTVPLVRTAIGIGGAASGRRNDWDEQVTFVKEAEKLGVDMVWSAEAWGQD